MIGCQGKCMQEYNNIMVLLILPIELTRVDLRMLAIRQHDCHAHYIRLIPIMQIKRQRNRL